MLCSEREASAAGVGAALEPWVRCWATRSQADPQNQPLSLHRAASPPCLAEAGKDSRHRQALAPRFPVSEEQSELSQPERSAVTPQSTGAESLLRIHSPLCRQLQALVFALLLCKGVGKQPPHKSQGRKPPEPYQSIPIIEPNHLLTLKHLLFFMLTTCSGANVTYHSRADNHCWKRRL